MATKNEKKNSASKSSTNFNWKRICILVMTLIVSIVHLIILILTCVKLINMKDQTEEKTENVKTLIVLNIIGMLIPSIGFFGAFQEHFYLSMIYCVANIIHSIAMFVQALVTVEAWSTVVPQAVLILITIIYVNDIRTSTASEPSETKVPKQDLNTNILNHNDKC